MRKNIKAGIKLFLKKFLPLVITSYHQDLQAILKFLKVTGCYCCCYVIYKIVKSCYFEDFKKKLQRYVSLNSVIPNFVAFIVVMLRWHCLVFLSFLFFFLHFFEETLASRRKKFSLATPGAFVFHIRSNYGI